MNMVCTGFNTGVEYRSRRVAEFSAVVARLHLEFSKRVWWGSDRETGPSQEVNDVHVVIDAIQNEIVLFGALAVCLEITFASCTGTDRWNCAGGQLRYVDPVTPVERSVIDRFRAH